MLSTLRPFSHRFVRCLTSVLPSTCALCRMDAQGTLCAGCSQHFFMQHPVRCAKCAIALPHAYANVYATCGDCLKNPPYFDATVTVADYAAPIDQMVLALKFGGQLALASLFAQLLHEGWQRTALPVSPTLITAVPLSAQRLTERGFNQALEIARPLSQLLGIPLLPRVAIRVRDTLAQSSLPPNDRRKNMRMAFTVAPDMIDRIAGAHVGIVDDVMTTGETLGELAATLKRFGATRVTNFVFARSLH